MKILLACKERQSVTKEFRKLRHEAFSCDILHCSGGHPECHRAMQVNKKQSTVHVLDWLSG